MSPQLSLHEQNILGLGAGICIGAIVEAWHLGDVGIGLLCTMYKLTYIDALGLLKYIQDVVFFLLSCVDRKRSKKVKHDAVVNSLTAMGVHGCPHFNKLCSTVVSC